jgi:hypothetical protein
MSAPPAKGCHRGPLVLALVASLTKTLQEAMARIEWLELGLC